VTHEVLAIRYATLESRRRDLFFRYETYGEDDGEQTVEMAYYFWVLRSAQSTIVVDTGYAPAVGARRGRALRCDPVAAARAVGVEPDAVETVIVTHFHYDHVGNLAAYPNATLLVPRRELDFWTGPLAAREQFAAHVEAAEIAAIADADRAGRVRATDGVEEVAPGVTTITVGGHSPGQQLVRVAAAGGEVVLASDAVHFYEELERDRPFGVIADLGEMYEAYDLLKELAAAGATVVPGHDPEVHARFAAAGADGNAVRLDNFVN
jgi:glyoxylase-like metal-dependent hydrolase (beta-lactamase superfamily II)